MERVKQLLSVANLPVLWIELLVRLELAVCDRTLERLEALASWRKSGPLRHERRPASIGDPLAFAVVTAIAYAKLCFDEAVATGRKPLTFADVLVHWAGDAETEDAIGKLDGELVLERAPAIADHNWSNLYDLLVSSAPEPELDLELPPLTSSSTDDA